MIPPGIAQAASKPLSAVGTPSNTLTLDEAIATFLAESEVRRGKRTLAAYRLCLKLFRASCDKVRIGELD